MPVSGLVVTLAAEKNRAGQTASTRNAVIQQLRRHPQIQVGELQDNRLPVVIDTPDKHADKDCWAWLNSLPGVNHVDVAFIHFEDEDAFEHQACSANTERLITAPTIGET
ncbi:MAG: hypothetical protein R3C45_00990 [Phycisphaerales bacterium]